MPLFANRQDVTFHIRRELSAMYIKLAVVPCTQISELSLLLKTILRYHKQLTVSLHNDCSNSDIPGIHYCLLYKLFSELTWLWFASIRHTTQQTSGENVACEYINRRRRNDRTL